MGDREALTALYERYLPYVWRYVYSRLGGDEASSRDVVSETFLAMIQGVARLDAAGTSVAKWLSVVARNKLADHWRRSGRAVNVSDIDPAERANDPVAEADAAELRRTVGLVMASLDDVQRLALEWKYIDALTVGEIAGRLGRSEKAVEAVLYRAREAFRTHYRRTHDST